MDPTDANPKQQGRDAMHQRKKHADKPKGSKLVAKEQLKQGYVDPGLIEQARWSHWPDKVLDPKSIVAVDGGPMSCNCAFGNFGGEGESRGRKKRKTCVECIHMVSGITSGNSDTREEEKADKGKTKKRPTNVNDLSNYGFNSVRFKKIGNGDNFSSTRWSRAPGSLVNRSHARKENAQDIKKVKDGASSAKAVQ